MSTSSAPVSESTFSAREILEKFYRAEQEFTASSSPAAERDFSSVAIYFSDNFYMEQSSGLPWGGEYHGPAGLRTWMEKAAEYVEIDVRTPTIFENQSTPSRIVVISQAHFTSRHTGKQFDFPMSQVVDFDLDRGLITSIRPFYWDVKLFNQAIGYQS